MKRAFQVIVVRCQGEKTIDGLQTGKRAQEQPQQPESLVDMEHLKPHPEDTSEDGADTSHQIEQEEIGRCFWTAEKETCSAKKQQCQGGVQLELKPVEIVDPSQH